MPSTTKHRRYARTACAECAAVFEPWRVDQSFCSDDCRRRWSNRNRQRGIAVINLLMKGRLDRASAIGKTWRSRISTLAARYKLEDARANDGKGRRSYLGSLIPLDVKEVV